MRLRRRRPTLRDEATRVGERLAVRGHPQIRNDGELVIGDDVLFVSTPVESHLVAGPGARVVLGDGVVIGHGAAISAEAGVEIGAGARLGAFVTIMDTDFHVAGDHSVAPVPQPVSIGRDAVVGHHAIVMPGARVGDGARVAAGSVVSGVVPAGAAVAGNPAVPAGTRGRGAAGEVTVADVVADVFHLDQPAGPELTPDDVVQWDSLGALRLLLALEATYSILIDEQEMIGVRRVHDLEQLVAAARARTDDTV